MGKRPFFIGRPGTDYTNFPRHGAAVPQTADQLRQMSSQQAPSIRGSELITPYQSDIPAAEQIQGGYPTSRLPDVAFQPENSISFDFPVDPVLCAGGTLLTTWAPILNYEVRDQSKLVIKDMSIFLSNPRLVSIAEVQLRVNDVFKASVPIEKPCCCPLGFTVVIDGPAKMQILARTTGPSNRATRITGSFKGWLVPDALPQDWKYFK